jgi:hypothetical protein
MAMGSIRKIATLLVGILIAFLIANTLSDAVVILFQLKGAVGMIVSFILYAVFFFAVLHLIQRYAHIDFFGFDR